MMTVVSGIKLCSLVAVALGIRTVHQAHRQLVVGAVAARESHDQDPLLLPLPRQRVVRTAFLDSAVDHQHRVDQLQRQSRVEPHLGLRRPLGAAMVRRISHVDRNLALRSPRLEAVDLELLAQDRDNQR